MAEDFVGNQKLASAILEGRGHEVVLAEDGREAVAACAGSSFDVILMDVQMPIMDGFEATASIRQSEAISGGHTPIIALTARALSGDAELCLQAGMDDYVAKPFRPHELLQAVARAVPEAQLAATVTPPDETDGVLDRESVLEYVEGDVALLAELLEFIRNSAPKLLDEIVGLPLHDVQGLQYRAHALKNTVGVIGINDAHASALALENAASQQHLEHREELVAQCRLTSTELVDRLGALVDELQQG